MLHVINGTYADSKRLDGKEVETISAFLFHRGEHDDPARLAANAGRSFVGMFLRGMGFTFDDTDTKGNAAPISEMHALLAKGSRNQDVIYPFIGGEEVNSNPVQAYHRYAINFGNLDEAECRLQWPDVLAIVEQRVKPARDNIGDSAIDRAHKKRWWLYANDRPQLRAALAGLERVLVTNCGATPHLAFTFLSSKMVFAHSLAVFPLETYAAFCALQSHPHEIWARFFGSSMKDDLRYTPSDCFETYPFPKNWETNSFLKGAGKEYYEFRAALMMGNNEGLTKTYNRFNDPEERSPGIHELRKLHVAMDRAVLDAYGWVDIATVCEFLLDYEADEDESGRKKKPWRYRWPDSIHDEVLARLLALNAERASDERLAGRKTHLSKAVL